MKILAVIPARGGSKRLPGKNQAVLDGLPLIAWTLRVARLSDVFYDVLVSTDDEQIAETARTYGGKVPWLRPTSLAQDHSTQVDVLSHALRAWELDRGEQLDAACLLQPTSPFRRPETIRQAAAKFKQSKGLSVIGVSAMKTHPSWSMKLSEHEYLEPLEPKGLKLSSQQLPPIYAANGAVYFVSRDYLLDHGDLYTKPLLAIITDDPIEAIDIDTPFDWAVAEHFAPRINQKFNMGAGYK